MLLGTYRFDCQLLSDAGVPLHKGSMLRGAFGHAFKQVSCALRRRECGSCLLSGTCPYSLVFENHSVGQGAPTENPVRTAAKPHPYAMQPPLETVLSYPRGESFSFGISLFGRANDFLPHIIYAVQLMGETGIGRGAKQHGAGRFALTRVISRGQALYTNTTNALAQGLPLEQLSVAVPTPLSPPPAGHLDVTFTTPLRLKHQNRLLGNLPFHVLIRTALRRVSTLEQYYGAGEPRLDYQGMIRRAEEVTTGVSDCRWLDWGRYSSRQKTAMLLGGLVGTIRYEGQVDEFLPLLRYCEQTQLGKQTAFGLGQFSVTSPALP